LDGHASMPPPAGGLRPPADTSRVRDTHPLVSIFFFPRATIRHVVNTNPELHLAVLLLLTGFFNTLERASNRGLGDRVNVWILVVAALALAPLALPFSRIGAWLGEWAGSKFGGVASRDEVRAAYAWAGVPGIMWSLLFWPIQFALFGEEMFTTATPFMDESNPILLLAIGVSGLFAYLWSIIIGLHVFAEVHQFSAWRSAGAAALMFCIIAVPLLAIGGLALLAAR
jgi:Yip1 domain